jgi:hypothetical protein
MSLTDGQQKMINHIVTMDDPPGIALPNGPGVGLPRYVIQEAGGLQRTFDMAGTVESFPEIVVRVETEDGEYATENNALVKALVARFKPGTRFDGVTILDPASPRPPLRGGGVYAVPVIIRGRYVFNSSS